MVRIEVKGIRETRNFLDKKKRNTEKQEAIGLAKAALFLQGEVKESIAGRRAEKTSVDTGRFLNSVDLEVGKEDAMVFSKVKHAKFLEFGTSKIAPRRHFNNSTRS